jgi:hypothetical protein
MFKSRLGSGVAVAIARDHLRGAFNGDGMASNGDGMARVGLARPPDTVGARLAAMVQAVWPPQNPHKSGVAALAPTEYPRTRRHNAAFSGTAASMAVLALTGLYAGRAG